MPEVRPDATDAAELAEMLQFLVGWLDRDPARLAASLAQFVGHPAYGIGQLCDDLARFAFLLGGDEEPLFGTQRQSPPRPQIPAKLNPAQPACKMTSVSAITARRGKRFWTGVAQSAVALVLVAAGIFALWYRKTYNVWPGQGASARVHWCGRNYESFGGPSQTQRQISTRDHFLIHPVGQYPPLALARQQLFAAVVIGAQRQSVSPPPLCAMIVYLRTGPDQYRAYSLEGGP
jgi:hypothetical protein